MKLVNFSVTNYRSITTAHKINLKNSTVLVGKNNEGKSNLLMALKVAMTALMYHGRTERYNMRHQATHSRLYDWKRDFPIQLQERKSGLESIFRLQFRLEESELSDFHLETGIRANENIPIEVRFSKNNNVKIEVPKRGSSSFKQKSDQIAYFISKRISFNYIQAVRTERMALDVLREVIYGELSSLYKNDEYNQAIQKIDQLQQSILDEIALQLIEPLKIFLPQLKEVKIKKPSEDFINRMYRNDIDVIIDDGIPTNISYKGDGIKSLTTLAILKDRSSKMPASIIAIEEPESHLHSGAIHSLVEVINKIAENNQVIISTHNPLFVQQNDVKSNIIVNSGTAQPAKNIAEIRSVLGVLPSDNLRNASHVLVVEGEDDKIALTKLLTAISPKVSEALTNNILIIKPLGGASNLSHDLLDLRHCMCNYFVLMDNDEAGIAAIDKAISNGVLTEADYKLTICNGSPQAEFEDCIKSTVYADVLLEKFNINIDVPQFRGKEKWSDRVKNVRLSQGGRWNERIEQDIKFCVAESIPEKIEKLDDVLLIEKAGFIFGVASALERLLETRCI